MEPATFNLWHSLRDLAHRYGLPPLWRWWVTELGSFVPSTLKRAVGRRRARPVLAFEAGSVVLWAPRTSEGVLELAEVARVPIAGDAAAVSQAGRAAIERLPLEARGRGNAATKVIIALPGSQVLRKQFELPAAVEENLKQAIAWDLDRHTPFPPEQLYFDAIVIGRDTQKREIRVDWAAALRTHVDQARRLAEGWGAIVVGVTPDVPGVAGRVPAASRRLNLLPEDARTETTPWRRWQVWAPLALLLAAILLAVGLPVWQKRDYTITMAQVTEQARVQAAAADALRGEFERTTSDYNFALAKKYAYPPTVQLIEDVSKLLPDDTWLLQMELKGATRGKEAQREMLLRGESGSAGRLVALLEESTLFEQASPRSPMTKIQPGPGEIFDIGAQLKPLPPPSMIELAAAASAGPEGSPGATPPAAAAPAGPEGAPQARTPPAGPAPAAGPAPVPPAAPGAGPAPVPPAAPSAASAVPGAPASTPPTQAPHPDQAAVAPGSVAPGSAAPPASPQGGAGGVVAPPPPAAPVPPPTSRNGGRP
jgi:general secretion pathway protein L